VVIECMAMGRPLVAPNHGGAAEMGEHDETALLFKPKDSDSLADAIQRLYREDGLGKRIGMAARGNALATFAVDKHVLRVMQVYNSVLEIKDAK
jgi:glycosyltransferase involved in cell wall biosynthesis